MIEGYGIDCGALHRTSEDQATVWLCVAPDAAEQLDLHRRLGIGAQAIESSLDQMKWPASRSSQITCS